MVALRVHGREICRKRRDMMIVLLRVIRKSFFAQFPARPREIKWMFQEMFLRDVIVDLIEMFVHNVPSVRDLISGVQADFKMCLMPRMGIMTQSGRLFSS